MSTNREEDRHRKCHLKRIPIIPYTDIGEADCWGLLSELKKNIEQAVTELKEKRECQVSEMVEQSGFFLLKKFDLEAKDEFVQ